MIGMLSALTVFAGLLIGTYGIAVLEHMATHGVRRVRLALLLPITEGLQLFR